jgi:hypothetical protein
MNSDHITKHDLDFAISELKQFILERETALIWKVIALQVTLIGTIAGVQWIVLVTFLKPQ